VLVREVDNVEQAVGIYQAHLHHPCSLSFDRVSKSETKNSLLDRNLVYSIITHQIESRAQAGLSTFFFIEENRF
jgi:hypothetical protein